MGEAREITISKEEYNDLVVAKIKYGMLLEAVVDTLYLNYDKSTLRALDGNKRDVAQVVRTIEPAIFNGVFAKLKKEEKENKNESVC